MRPNQYLIHETEEVVVIITYLMYHDIAAGDMDDMKPLKGKFSFGSERDMTANMYLMS